MEDAGGFAIEEVEMHGFMRYVGGRQVIQFPPGFTVITGKTGAGKSTILDAITYALYGCTTRTDPPSNVKAADLFQQGGNVRVSFRQRDRRYEVRRGFNSRGGSFLDLNQDDAPLGGTIPEKEKMIVNIVGLDYEGFKNSTFVRQEEMKELGSEKGSDRLRVFQKLFRLETFEKAQVAAQAAFKEVEDEAKDAERKIEIRRGLLAKMPEMINELQEVEENLARDKAANEDLKVGLRKAETDLHDREAGHEEFVKLTAKVTGAEKRVTDLTRRLEKVRKEAERSAELKRKESALEKELSEYEKLREEEKGLTERQSSHRLAQKDVEAAVERKRDAEAEHKERLSSITERLFATEKRIAKLKTDVGKEEAFGLLRSEGGLAERIDRIEKEIVWLEGKEDLVARIKGERLEAEARLLDVGDRAEKINEDSFILDELKRQVESMKDEIRREDEGFAPRLAKLEDDVQRTMTARESVRFTQADERSLSEIAKVVSRLKDKSKEIDGVRAKLKEVGDAAKLVADLEEQRGNAQAEALTASRALEDRKQAEEAYAEARRRLDELRSKAEKSAKELGKSEEAAKRLAKQLDDLRAEEATIAESEKSLKRLRERGEILAILKDEVFHRRGVVKFAIDQLMPALEIEASRNLADMTDGRFNKVRLETYEESGRHGVRISVEGVDGRWHDIGEFSGGERTQINAALRFAIAQQLASMPQIGGTYGRMKMLFIDEGDLGSLDTESSRDLFVQKLFRMGDFFDKVVLITHLTEVAERFQSRMHVEMNDRGESRVEAAR